MYKIFKQQIAHPNDNTKTVEKIRQYLNEGFEYKTPTANQVFFMKYATILVSFGSVMILVGIIGMIIVNLTMAIILGLIGSIIALMSIPGFSMKKKYVAVSRSQLQPKQHNIYKLWFEDIYEDVDVDKLSNTDALVRMARQSRGEGIPSDARATEVRDGYALIGKNKSYIQAITILWHWTRTSGSGKNRRTQHYYVRKCYMLTTGIKDTYTDFQFKMRLNNIFRKGKDKLENSEFNKKFIVESNDPVRLRVLLTPSVQEEAIKYIKFSQFELEKTNIGIFSSFTIPESDSTFIVNMRNFKDIASRDGVINAFLFDIVDDIVTYQSWVAGIAVFRTLFETI